MDKVAEKWRPAGWDSRDIAVMTPVYKITGDELLDLKISAVEVGADAILKSLRKQPYLEVEPTVRNRKSMGGKQGKWYFLPDDAKK